MSGHATPALQRIRLAEINADRRLRPVSDAGVEAILASVAEIGRIKDPIHLRRSKRGLTLLAGAHRLEAHRRLGAEEVDAWVWSGITDDRTTGRSAALAAVVGRRGRERLTPRLTRLSTPV